MDDSEVLSDVQRMSIAPAPRSPYRESTVESANQAEGIFDLYNTGRESWASTTASHATADTVHAERALPNRSSALPAPPRIVKLNSNGNGHLPVSKGTIEEMRLEDESQSPTSWEGPAASLTQRMPGNPRLSAGSGGGSVGGGVSTPPIRVTSSASVAKTPDRRSVSYDLANSTMTSSTASSPVHPSIARLSPRPSGTGTGTNTSSASTSQLSIAASSQYPGEEADAFFVRSTYARLEVEGVYGDGWDEGVERTRGGSANGARKTLMLPSDPGELSEQELGFRSRLDRYGFVDEPLRNRQESRLAQVPSAPFQKIPKLPSTSPLKGKEPAQPSPAGVVAGGGEAGPSARPPPERIDGEAIRRAKRKEEERVGKWMKMMSVKRRDTGGNVTDWKWSQGTEGAKHARRVYKGVPDRWRMAAWWTLADERALAKGKDKYRSVEQLQEEYLRRIDLPSTSDVQIDLDVPRTISGHVLFQTRFGQGQRSLFHVLHSFSQLCETCGYCQGMGSIAATLLCYFEPERAYALLVRIHDVYDMHGIFAPGFPGLLETFYVQERLIEYLMPDVYQSFQKNMISSSSWGAKIYITLFVNTVPFDFQLRLWDAMFLDGYDVMILATVAIVWAFKDLLSAKIANFESILSLLSSFYVIEDEDKMMRWIRKMLWQSEVKLRIGEWRLEWSRLVDEGKAQAALL